MMLHWLLFFLHSVATDDPLSPLRALFPGVPDDILNNLPRSPAALLAIKEQRQKDLEDGAAAEGRCDHCQRSGVRRFDAMSVLRSGDDDVAALVESGTAFVVSNATAECSDDPAAAGFAAYWERYVSRVVALAGNDVTGRVESMFRDRAFLTFGTAHAKDMEAAWGEEELEWCAAANGGVACSGGQVDRGRSIVETVHTTLGSAAHHDSDFYAGWSNIDSEVAALATEDYLRPMGAAGGCVPILASPRYVARPDGCQWWRVGRAVHAPVVGESRHIDRVGGRTECHLQISGRKVWRLEAPDWCLGGGDGGGCDGWGPVDVPLGPRDLFCVGVDRHYHTTFLPVHTVQAHGDCGGAPLSLSVDVAYDVWGVKDHVTPAGQRDGHANVAHDEV